MTDTSARRVLLLGGTSEIGLAILRRMAQQGPIAPTLAGRDMGQLERELAALQKTGCTGGCTAVLDASDTALHVARIREAFRRAGSFDVVILAVGILGAYDGFTASHELAVEVMHVDFTGAGSLAMATLTELAAQRHGTLVVLSSVAVERPRASNAVYGAAKAGLDALAQGLADGVHASGVRVLVVRPGFVRGRMTEGLPVPPFSTTPERVANATVEALSRSTSTIWVPGVLRLVFGLLRLLPRPLWRRLPL